MMERLGVPLDRLAEAVAIDADTLRVIKELTPYEAEKLQVVLRHLDLR
jgi:hypothetical protein